MKYSGITRPIDKLGRIVIPKEFRKCLGIEILETLEIFLIAETIVIKKRCHPYIRVSNEHQNEARQLEALKNLKLDKIFIEKKSGKTICERPRFCEMMNYLREGDTLYILDFSRISRSTADLLKILEELETRKIKLISLKENLDTSTATGKLMVTMIAAINQFERENLLERQRQGIEIAKKEGKYKGRKPIEKPKNWDEIIEKYFQKDITSTEAMKQLNLKKTSFYNFLNQSIREHPRRA